MVLHVFLVPIISSHDKLWGLARRVFTLFGQNDPFHIFSHHIFCLKGPMIGGCDKPPKSKFEIWTTEIVSSDQK